jgi:hypothetical protein
VLQCYNGVYLLDPKDEHEKFIMNGKKDEVVGVMLTYIYREIHFHTSEINLLNQVWKKLKTMFDKIDESQVMQIEKELMIS